MPAFFCYAKRSIKRAKAKPMPGCTHSGYNISCLLFTTESPYAGELRASLFPKDQAGSTSSELQPSSAHSLERMVLCAYHQGVRGRASHKWVRGEPLPQLVRTGTACGYIICCLVPDPSKDNSCNSATDAACTLKWHEGVMHIKVPGVFYFPKRRMGGTTI